MRTLSMMAFTSFLILWGIHYYLKNNLSKDTYQIAKQSNIQKKLPSNNPDSPLYQKKRKDLDKIGNVINDKNVEIGSETKEQIKKEKKVFEIVQNLKEKQNILEQSYVDRASSIKDIKRLQGEIIDIKNRSKMEIFNTEKWDPKFVYYLMLQENYTYQEINTIRSLTENGLSPEEVNYISELVREDAFLERINAFKSQDGIKRAIASDKKAKFKEKDDFMDNGEESAGVEAKLIEMDYNQDERGEMVYGTHK